MECPKCKYINGWDPDTLQSAYGEEGNFFTISNEVKMIKENRADRYIIGCPKCGILFMGDI